MEFEFFLAEQLHMTVASMRETMSQDEFVRWNIYYARKAQQAELRQKSRR